MGSISVNNGAFTHTVSAPGRPANTMANARLQFLTERLRLIQSFAPVSYSAGTASFAETIFQSNLNKVADCLSCLWFAGKYQVVVDDGQLLGSPVLDFGSVSFSGILPCVDCGGTAPPPPATPPGGGSGGDSPYGTPTDWEPGVGPPPNPPATCLPPAFTQPSAPVPSPCGGGGSGGSGAGGFANPTP
jgi:hypothetical protein